MYVSDSCIRVWRLIVSDTPACSFKLVVRGDLPKDFKHLAYFMCAYAFSKTSLFVVRLLCGKSRRIHTDVHLNEMHHALIESVTME